jgi:3-hydroxyacyl-CoA dehydrogenase
MSMRNRAVALVGLGLVGRSWLRVFTRVGFPTRVWDPDPEQVDAGWNSLKEDLKLARKYQGLRKAVARSQRELVTRCETLEEAVAGAAYVQECTLGRLEAKRKLFAAMDQASGPRAILATSSAAFDLGSITSQVASRGRCVIAHPVQLPHLLPAVEICPGPETEPAVVRRTLRFMSVIGLEPIPVRRFIVGLVADRLRAALLREALHIVAEEIADAPAVDNSVKQGVGMLWAVAGPFSASAHPDDGGLREQLAEQAVAYKALWRDLANTVDVNQALIDRLARSVDGPVRGLPPEEQRIWREEMIERIRRLKHRHPLGGQVED